MFQTDNVDNSEYLAPNRYLTVRETIVALRTAQGSVIKASDALNVTPHRLSRFIGARPQLINLMKSFRSCLVDLAESHLIDAIQNGERWAVQLVLKTLGKHKGYTEKQEISHTHRLDHNPVKMDDTMLSELVAKKAKEKRLEQRKMIPVGKSDVIDITIEENELTNAN